MKKIYEAAEMNIILFATADVIIASGETTSFVPSYTKDDNETELL